MKRSLTLPWLSWLYLIGPNIIIVCSGCFDEEADADPDYIRGLSMTPLPLVLLFYLSTM